MRVATNGSNGPIRIPPIPTCLPTPVRQQLRIIRDEVPPMSDTAFSQLVDILTKQHDENRKTIQALELSVTTIRGQVDLLMGVHTDRVVDRKQDVRKVKDVVLQIAVVILLTGLLTLGVQYVKGTPQPPQPDPQAGVSSKIDTLIEEIRTDRAQRESEPAQTIKVPPRKRTRPAPEPQRLNRLNDDVLARPTFRAYSKLNIESMERR